MYKLIRTARVRGAGRLGETIAWAKEVAEYVTAQYPLVQVQAFTQRFGTVGAIYWTIDVDSEDLAELDRFLKRWRKIQNTTARSLKQPRLSSLSPAVCKIRCFSHSRLVTSNTATTTVG